MVLAIRFSYSSHDRHYFKNARDLVAGSVMPARIDLVNQELLHSHLNALYLSEVGLRELTDSLEALSDNTDFPTLPLRDAICQSLIISKKKQRQLKEMFEKIVHDFENQLQNSTWYSPNWIEDNIERIATHLDSALNRWRGLYVAAMNLLDTSTNELKSGRHAVQSKEYKLQKSNQFRAQQRLDNLHNTRVPGQSGPLSEFYPYRYLAFEGFLPGYNFPRLPLRASITKGDGSEYIARPRTIALREFGPGNRIYHSGTKYQIRQLVIQDAVNRIRKGKICTSSGYFLDGEQFNDERCPFTGVSLQDNSNKEILVDLLEMSDSNCEEVERISCEEEERISQGFEIATYFAVDPSILDKTVKATLVNQGDEFLHLRFIPAARLFHINKKWRATQTKGFPLRLNSGLWKLGSLPKKTETSEDIRQVMLFTTDIADALYMEPIEPLGLNYAGIITLQYALKKAIGNIFQIEPGEIAVESMGGKSKPNIFLHEAAEGSLGILSQFVESPDIFAKVIAEAIRLCRFDDPNYQEPADYDDLLSYYNQRQHRIIDRFLIKDALDKLQACSVEIQTNKNYRDYDSQYQALLRGIDPNSSTERKFIDFLYKNALRLPDKAQPSVPEQDVYVKPDFLYEPDVYIFCDGTPHDRENVKKEDHKKRSRLKSIGYQVLVYYYRDDLEELVKKRPDIFKKVK